MTFKKNKIIFFTILGFITFVTKVNAVTVNVKPIIADNNKQVTFTIAYGSTTDGTLYPLGGIQVGSDNKNAYCVDIYDGFPYSGYPNNVANPPLSFGANPINFDVTDYKELSAYLKEHDYSNSLTTEQIKTATKKMNEYLYFGYEYNNQNNYKYNMATQALIWELLFQNGYFKKFSPVAGRTNGLIYFNAIGYPHVTYNPNEDISIANEKSKIKANIEEWYETPTYCNTNYKLNLTVGEKTTLTHSSIADYTVTCSSGLTCNKSGNKLEITATEKKSNLKITFTKKASGTAAVVYIPDPVPQVNQGLVTGGKPDDVSCSVTPIVNEPTEVVCTDDERKTVAACQKKANEVCGSAGYSGCNITDSNKCYVFTCKSCADDERKTPEACRAKANEACGNAGYTGCTNSDIDDDACYTFICKVPENPKTGTAAIIIAWIIGIMTIGYASWYYYKSKSFNN